MVFRFFNFRRKAKQWVWLLSTLCFVQQSVAAEIVMEAYQYSSESPIHFSEGESFVICDCPESPDLARALVTPPLALKASALQKAPSKTTPVKGVKMKSKPARFTIPFGFDADRLSTEAIKKLNKVIKKIEAMPGNIRIAVLGYTCDIGPEGYNKQLSLRRAETVARRLKAQGLRRVDIEGKGSCCPISKKRGLNRRVEIRVEIIEPEGAQS